MFEASTIKQRAVELGFDLVGIAPPSALKDLELLPQWIKKGFGGEMRYLADPRREDPRRVLPSVKSIICVGLVYNAPYAYSTEVDDSAKGKDAASSRGAPTEEMHSRAWISRYAWGKDYHDVMRSKLEQLRAAVEKLTSDAETRVYADTGPLLERAFARLSGIGWMGKNTCLINQRKGSWFFLGVVLTNLELALDLPAPDRCGSCTRCLEACPTEALVEPYVMDASRCIAYFNIELKGAIPEQFRTAIGRNVYGCDICQDVCPWNRRPLSTVSGPLHDNAGRDVHPNSSSTTRSAESTTLPEFQPLQIEIKWPFPPSAPYPESNSTIMPTKPFSLFNPSLEGLASLTEEDFRKLFAHSPIKRVKYRGWLRNLCVAMGNSRNRRFIAWLEDMAQHSDPMVREHATWALKQLQTTE